MVILLVADMLILPAMQAIQLRHAWVIVRQIGTTLSSSVHISSFHMDSLTVSGPEDKLAHLHQPEHRSTKQWKGPLPEDMLAKLWTPGLMRERTVPAMHCEVITLSQYLGILRLTFLLLYD